MTLASSVSVMTQNRTEFRTLLEKALAVDADKVPTRRLETLIVQQRARSLLQREDDLFIDSDKPEDAKK